ncbi:MAG: phage portal protein [Acidaminococcaceae bacterium]|jgi:HK97 family phage portal protein|nr:phage portal protein [Acidaminococcaceae bacterium]
MNFVDKLILKRAEKLQNIDSGTVSLSNINSFLQGLRGQYGSDLGEITYFICLKMLSEALGKLPLHLVDADKRIVPAGPNYDSFWALQVEPNPVQTPIQFWTYLELCRNHWGNGYAYIDRDSGGKVRQLLPLHPRQISIYVNNTGQNFSQPFMYRYQSSKSGNEYWLRPDQLLHVKSWICTDDGLAGKPVHEIIADYMTGNKASTQVLNDLYKNGLTANSVVNYIGDLSETKKKKIIEQMQTIANTKGGRVIPLPYDWKLQPLDLKLVDSQFYELKKYSSLQVAAAFGIKPNDLNDYSKSSYANSTAQNLSFYVSTLLYNISLYEQELKRRLLREDLVLNNYEFKFNVNVILRADPVQQSQIISNYVKSAVYKIDEGRRMAGAPPLEHGNGNVVLVPSGFATLDSFLNNDKAGDIAPGIFPKGGNPNGSTS